MKNFIKSFLLVVLAVVSFSTVSFAQICVPSGTASTLSFTAPSTNTDGTALIDLAGFKVYFSNTAGTESTGTIKDVAMDSVSAPGGVGSIALSSLGLLDGKTYFFEITAYDTALLESSFSNEISCIYDSTIPKSPSGLGIK